MNHSKCQQASPVVSKRGGNKWAQSFGEGLVWCWIELGTFEPCRSQACAALRNAVLLWTEHALASTLEVGGGIWGGTVGNDEKVVCQLHFPWT